MGRGGHDWHLLGRGGDDRAEMGRGGDDVIPFINAQLRLQGAINVRFHNNTSTETEDALTN